MVPVSCRIWLNPHNNKQVGFTEKCVIEFFLFKNPYSKNKNASSTHVVDTRKSLRNLSLYIEVAWAIEICQINKIYYIRLFEHIY